MVAVAIGSGGCTSGFDRQYEAAERWRLAAADAGYEWIETEALLQQAREAHEAGDRELALELVEQARFQGEAAVQQAEREAQAWQARVLR